MGVGSLVAIFHLPSSIFHLPPRSRHIRKEPLRGHTLKSRNWESGKQKGPGGHRDLGTQGRRDAGTLGPESTSSEAESRKQESNRVRILLVAPAGSPQLQRPSVSQAVSHPTWPTSARGASPGSRGVHRIRVRRPARRQDQIHIQQPAHGQSSNILFTFSVVMGGAPGGASRNTSSPSRTRRAFRGCGSDGRRRAVRKRTNSTFCSGGSASAAASTSSSLLISKVYHR